MPAGIAGAPAPRLLVGGLSLVVLIVAILQTSVIPVLGKISEQLREPAVSVSWAVTANLLTAAAATPLIGRMADLRNKKRVLIGVLALVLAGSLLAAITSSLPLLVVGRMLQALAYALFPVAVSIVREELPPEALVRSIAVMSAMLGFGGGFGLVVTGLLMTEGASYHRVFWFGAAVTATALVAAWMVVPGRSQYVAETIDWIGSAALATGLAALLLAITEGSRWGWTSPAILVSAVIGLGVMWWWWSWSKRCPNALVPVTILKRRPILLGNIATLFVGMGLYFSFLGTTGFVEAPMGSGYGFNASVLDASVEFLLPGALAAAVTALLAGRYIERYGPRVVVAAGAFTGALGFASLAIWHTHPWQVVLAGLLTNAYISLGFGALPVLVLQSGVAEHETGIATSLNAIFRKVGSAIAAAMLAGVEKPAAANGFIPENAFLTIFILGAVTALAVLLLAWRRQ
jgi:MFS family permease